MIYDIRHVTTFDYGGAVKFARCNLRLKPIAWSGQHLADYGLSVSPHGRLSPVHETGLVNVTRLVIDEPVRHLSIESVARVTVDRLIPFPETGDPTLGEVAALTRASRDASAMGPATYLYPSPRIALDAAIGEWCAQDLAPDRNALEAAIALAQRIQREFEFDPTATLVDTAPSEAFAKRRGVCQDFAQIMIAGLRTAGLPAAYASGYIRTLPAPGQERLVGADATHAWVLLWCGPERGWIGVDPTNGIWMAADHILIAVGRDYGDISPVDGVVLGSGAQDMQVSVDVAPVPGTSTTGVQIPD